MKKVAIVENKTEAKLLSALNDTWKEIKRLRATNEDLLEALRECAEQLALLAKDPKNNPWVQQAYAAIAKATEPVRRERK